MEAKVMLIYYSLTCEQQKNIVGSYNKTEKDFPTLLEYNNYLEEVEDISELKSLHLKLRERAVQIISSITNFYWHETTKQKQTLTPYK